MSEYTFTLSKNLTVLSTFAKYRSCYICDVMWCGNDMNWKPKWEKHTHTHTYIHTHSYRAWKLVYILISFRHLVLVLSPSLIHQQTTIDFIHQYFFKLSQNHAFILLYININQIICTWYTENISANIFYFFFFYINTHKVMLLKMCKTIIYMERQIITRVFQ